MHPNISRAGLDAHRRPSAVDLAGDVVVVLSTLRQHLLVGVNAARAGGSIQRKCCAAGPELDISRAGIELPVRSRRSAHVDASRARVGAQAAAQIAQLDVARAGPRLHVSRAGLLGIDVARAGVDGEPSVDTGSGNIYAEQTGTGDVKAGTGSGNIELRNLHGGLRAHTGSGSIHMGGTPASDWKLDTGSGNVEFWAGSAAFTLDASAGSGSIHTDQEMLTQGTQDHHHVTGKINGGGPTVRIETGSGDIRVH